MRKEILFAIIAGALFGLIIAFGVWKANSSLKPGGQTTTQQEISSSSSPQTNLLGITLSQPNAYEILSQAEVTLKGITRADNWISISGENKDYILKSNTNGSFDQSVELIPGVNEITATSFDQNGDSTFIKVVVVYSSEFNKSESVPKNE